MPRRSFLLQLATSRGLIWAVEQPLNSLFFAEACMQSMLRAARTHRVMTWMGAFGGHTMKPLELHGCIPIALFRKLAKVKSLAIHALGSRKARNYVHGNRVNRGPKPKSNSVRTGWRRGSWINKTSNLKVSQVYPWKFGLAVAQICTDHLSEFPSSLEACAL